MLDISESVCKIDLFEEFINAAIVNGVEVCEIKIENDTLPLCG